MWKSLKSYLADHEKVLIPIYVLAIILIFVFPEYLFQIPLTLYLLFKIFDVATDKSTNSTVKEIRTLLGEKTPPVV